MTHKKNSETKRIKSRKFKSKTHILDPFENDNGNRNILISKFKWKNEDQSKKQYITLLKKLNLFRQFQEQEITDPSNTWEEDYILPMFEEMNEIGKSINILEEISKLLTDASEVWTPNHEIIDDETVAKYSEIKDKYGELKEIISEIEKEYYELLRIGATQMHKVSNQHMKKFNKEANEEMFKKRKKASQQD